MSYIHDTSPLKIKVWKNENFLLEEKKFFKKEKALYMYVSWSRHHTQILNSGKAVTNYVISTFDMVDFHIIFLEDKTPSS